jgi:D-alanyl-D-alanine carboxypeptidase/D-alanyl-D-alanine-endopeptidase (penicillin-binding protein 4)
VPPVASGRNFRPLAPVVTPVPLPTAPAPRLLLLVAVLLAALGLAPAAAAAADAAGLRAALARHAARLGPSSAVVVRDLGTGEELFARRADRRLVPASNQKLYVTAGALLELGTDARLRTEVRLAPQARVDEAGVVRGDLELVGGGDPSLGDAGLLELAREVEGRGITRVTGGLVADEDLFDLRRGSARSGFAPDLDVGGSLGALVWRHGRTGPGGPGVQAALRLQGLLRARGIRTGRGARAATAGARARAAQVQAAQAPAPVVPPPAGGTVPPPAPPAPGGAQPAPPVSGGAVGEVGEDAADALAPPQDTLLADAQSPPLAALAAATNVPSDNFYAEMLVKVLGARNGAGGTTGAGLAVLRSALRARIGIGPQLADGSGLSRANRTSARELVTLLGAMPATPAGPAFTASLARPGRSGTLRKRMRGTGAGRCPAKTGTLRGVSALSGYCVTASGRTLAFAILSNGVHTPAAKRVEDRIVPVIAGYSG